MKLEEKHKKCTAANIGKNQSGDRNEKSPGNFQIKLGFCVDYFGDT